MGRMRDDIGTTVERGLLRPRACVADRRRLGRVSDASVAVPMPRSKPLRFGVREQILLGNRVRGAEGSIDWRQSGASGSIWLWSCSVLAIQHPPNHPTMPHSLKGIQEHGTNDSLAGGRQERGQIASLDTFHSCWETFTPRNLKMSGVEASGSNTARMVLSRHFKSLSPRGGITKNASKPASLRRVGKLLRDYREGESVPAQPKSTKNVPGRSPGSINCTVQTHFAPRPNKWEVTYTIVIARRSEHYKSRPKSVVYTESMGADWTRNAGMVEMAAQSGAKLDEST